MMATDLDGTVAVIISKPGHTNVCILSITDDRSRKIRFQQWSNRCRSYGTASRKVACRFQ